MKKSTLFALTASGLIGCAASGLLPLSAFAQDLPPGDDAGGPGVSDQSAPAPVPPGSGGHTHHSGSITHDQWMAHANQKFSQLDTNHDGTISPDERQAAKQHSMERHAAKNHSAPDMGDEQ